MSKPLSEKELEELRRHLETNYGEGDIVRRLLAERDALASNYNEAITLACRDLARLVMERDALAAEVERLRAERGALAEKAIMMAEDQRHRRNILVAEITKLRGSCEVATKEDPSE